MNLKPDMIKLLNIKQSLAFLNHKEELYALHDLIRLISQAKLRPCFYFDRSMQTLPDSGYSQNIIATIDDGFNFSGYITPLDIKPLASALMRSSSDEEIIHFSTVKVIESTDAQYFVRLPKVLWHNIGDIYAPVIFEPSSSKKINSSDVYVLIQSIGQFGKNIETGYDFDARSCLFIESELEQIQTPLSNPSSSMETQIPLVVSNVVNEESKIWENLVQRADAVREVMVAIFKADTEISGGAMWAALYKMAENEVPHPPFLGVNENKELIYDSKGQADADSKTIDKRNVERRLRTLKNDFKAIKA